jgi:hypothetical protein
MVQDYMPASADYEHSPYTGFGREAWIDAGRRLLEGYFRHLDPETGELDFFTKAPLARDGGATRSAPGTTDGGEARTARGAPHGADARSDGDRSGETRSNGARSPKGAADFERMQDVPVSRRFEAFSRVFILLGPMLAARPGLRAGGPASRPGQRDADEAAADIDLEAFAAESLERYLAPWGSAYIGMPQPRTSPFQLVQWVGLLFGFWSGGRRVWRQLPERLRRAALDNLSACAHHRSNAHNWLFFNVLAFAFLREEGYPVDESWEQELLELLAGWYAGDGWYRDGQQFDYYNAWAFQTYAAVWTSLESAGRYPDLRRLFRQRLQRFLESYPRFFSADGHSLLWGRSSVYRFAASAPFAAAFMPDGTGSDLPISPGRARRILSGNLLQFLRRDDTFIDGIPSLGFYRPFAPMLQSYSGPGSFGWMHKAFLALALPAESPFWTDAEAPSSWEPAAKGDAHVEVLRLSGPGLTLANYPQSGATVLLPGKVGRSQDMLYSRPAYHSGLPVEADAPEEQATAMTYSGVRLPFPDEEGSESLHAVQLRDAGYREGVLYRRLYLARHGGAHPTGGILLDMADIPTDDGLLHLARVRAPFPYILRFASFGVPEAEAQVDAEGQTVGQAGGKAGVRSRARTQDVPPIRLIPLLGWDRVYQEEHRDLNPAAVRSLVSVVERRVSKMGAGASALCAVLQRFHADARAGESDAELPELEVRRIHPESGSLFGVTLRLPGGAGAGEGGRRRYHVDFGAIEGMLSS